MVDYRQSQDACKRLCKLQEKEAFAALQYIMGDEIILFITSISCLPMKYTVIEKQFFSFLFPRSGTK